MVAKFAHDHLHATRVGILYDQQQAYSKGLAREFDRAFRALGGTITTRQAYTGGDINLSAQLQSLEDTSPEAIFLPGYYNDAGNISIQARKITVLDHGVTIAIGDSAAIQQDPRGIEAYLGTADAPAPARCARRVPRVAPRLGAS